MSPIIDNPFICLSLSDDYLDPASRSGSIIRPFAPDQSYGVYSVYSFWKRFDIFTNGIFRGMNCDKIYFGGSLFMACAVRNPLEKLFGVEVLGRDTLTDQLFEFWDGNRKALEAYFDEYFPSKSVLVDLPDVDMLALEDLLSDIDIKIDVRADAEFDQIVTDIYQTILANTCPTNRSKVHLVKIPTPKSYKYFISGTPLGRKHRTVPDVSGASDCRCRQVSLSMCQRHGHSDRRSVWYIIRRG